MAVYTPLTLEQVADLAKNLGLTAVGALEPVTGGIENTTYFFKATRAGKRGSFVLTLAEASGSHQVRFSAALAAHLARAGLPVPEPLADQHGKLCHELADKPVLVVPRVEGHHPDLIDGDHCRAVGQFLARAHQAGETLALRHANPRGLSWLADNAAEIEARLAPGDGVLLAEQVERYRRACATGTDLPVGAIHGDLFRDNTLFRRDRLVGVIDFLFAGIDWLLVDVAVAVNDWCWPNGHWDRELSEALLDGYHAVRPFRRIERQYWQDVLCFAATRFWLSRLLQKEQGVSQRSDATDKDPGEYRDKLRRLLIAFPALPH